MASVENIYHNRLNADCSEIRTLSLLPGHYEDPIRCDLQTVSLRDGPTFTALSYVWGDARQKKPICADGKVFEATANLESALRNIRKADVAEVLWVDAVCINQEDTVERNQQVHLMKSIYSEAHAVLIWLGDGDEYSDTLFEIISKDGIPIQAMFSTIAKRPWWTRVWIVQE
ncbi:HET-domain-containing protein, partial [Hyaloscypha variabilis F]